MYNEFPKELNNPVTYGNNLKSLSALLSSDGIVSVGRMKKFICELTNGVFDLSEGTIVNFNKELSLKIKPVIKNIKEKLLTSPVNHKDETGIRINNVMNWFHVLSKWLMPLNSDLATLLCGLRFLTGSLPFMDSRKNVSSDSTMPNSCSISRVCKEFITLCLK